MDVAIVTGAAGGMGVAVCERLAADGYRVAAIDIDRAGLAAIEPTISRNGGRTYAVDLTEPDEVTTAVLQIAADLGPVVALVNLVGWTEMHGFLTESIEYWRKVMALNFECLLVITQAVATLMVERGSGRIVNVSSDAGKVGQSGEAVYAGAKGAVIAWSKSLARELARHHVNVNVVAPGPTETPLDAELDSATVARIVRLIPFRRKGQPAEQAAAISFLLSADARYITGQVLSVNGGLTMQ
jgi:2-hydroxycyclohexanecarboxyl-CoA dehydrogenase